MNISMASQLEKSSKAKEGLIIVVASLWLLSEGFPDCVSADAKTVSDGLLGVAFVAVELDPAVLVHRQQIEDRDDDQ